MEIIVDPMTDIPVMNGELLNSKYKKCVWMNPRYHKELTRMHWMESEDALSKLFHMYTLSVDGLKEAITYLLKTK